MEAYHLSPGDVVLVKSRRRKIGTPLVVLLDSDVTDDIVHFNKVAQRNLRVRTGDKVTIRTVPDIKYVSTTGL
jgi:translation initiation factor IF-1